MITCVFMMMKNFLFLLLCVENISTDFTPSLPHSDTTQKSTWFLSPQFYLVDSLAKNSISPADLSLLDSVLSIYHKTDSDTTRFRLLEYIIESITNEDIWPAYNSVLIELVDKALYKDSENKTLLRFKSVGIGNLGYLFQIRGENSKALLHYQTSFEIEKKIGNQPGMAISLNNIGTLYDFMGNYSKALEYYKKGLKIQKEVNDKKGLAFLLHNIANIYMGQGDIPNALKYFHTSLKIQEEIHDKKGISNALNDLGFIYKNQGDYPKAMEYYTKSLKTREEINDRQGMAESLNNIGSIYQNQNDLLKALEYFNNSLTIRESIHDKKGIANSLNNIGHIYRKQGEFLKALTCYYHSLKIKKEIHDSKGIVFSLTGIGTTWLMKNQFDSSGFYLAQSLKLAKELGLPELIRDASHAYQYHFRKQKNWEKALEMYDLYILMRDSIKNKETEKAMIKQQLKYEYEKAEIVRRQEEKEAAVLLAVAVSRRNTLQYSIIVIGLIVIGLVVALFLRLHVSTKIATGLVFISLLIFFEFVLVFIDPWVESVTGGAPVWKLLINAVVAMVIYPVHGWLEGVVRGRMERENTDDAG